MPDGMKQILQKTVKHKTDWDRAILGAGRGVVLSRKGGGLTEKVM